MRQHWSARKTDTGGEVGHRMGDDFVGLGETATFSQAEMIVDLHNMLLLDFSELQGLLVDAQSLAIERGDALIKRNAEALTFRTIADQNVGAAETIRKLRSALEMYADKANYRGNSAGPHWMSNPPIINDGGAMAREALKE